MSRRLVGSLPSVASWQVLSSVIGTIVPQAPRDVRRGVGRCGTERGGPSSRCRSATHGTKGPTANRTRDPYRRPRLRAPSLRHGPQPARVARPASRSCLVVGLLAGLVAAPGTAAAADLTICRRPSRRWSTPSTSTARRAAWSRSGSTRASWRSPGRDPSTWRRRTTSAIPSRTAGTSSTSSSAQKHHLVRRRRDHRLEQLPDPERRRSPTPNSQWLNSPGHKAIIVSTNYNYVGVGLALGLERQEDLDRRLHQGPGPDRREGQDRDAPTIAAGATTTTKRVTVTWTGGDVPLQVLTSGFHSFKVQRRMRRRSLDDGLDRARRGKSMTLDLRGRPHLRIPRRRPRQGRQLGRLVDRLRRPAAAAWARSSSAADAATGPAPTAAHGHLRRRLTSAPSARNRAVLGQVTRRTPPNARCASIAATNASTNPSAASGSKPSSHHAPRIRSVSAFRSIRGSIRPTNRSPNRIGRT